MNADLRDYKNLLVNSQKELEEMRELERLEKQEGKSKLDDN